MYALRDYDYFLPDHCIAQEPANPRDHSRLLYMDRRNGRSEHHRFRDIDNFLNAGDVLVVNDTRVTPARLLGRKESGGKIELLVLNYRGDSTDAPGDAVVSRCLIKASKRPRPGTVLRLEKGLQAQVLGFEDDLFTVRFRCDQDFESLLFQIGETPLPPYIKRNGNQSSVDDQSAYQTVYAKQTGAAAAPTAGLHFSHALLEKIRSKGVHIVAITLHVGHGTFAPVRNNDIRNHQMHSEWCTITDAAAGTINQALDGSGRVVAVGTTSVRTLEHACSEDGRIEPGSRDCDLFIYPGYQFRVIDALITNFHLPQSTLLMLVSAFAGRQKILKAYQTAIDQGYRFYSYGDAMLIA